MSRWIVLLTTLIMVGCQPLATMRDNPWLTAVGYASISEQKGVNDEEKQVRAMRASKIDAYRELAEQVYGMRVSGRADLKDQRLGTERTSGAVDGVIRGAEVVRSYKVGDSYVTELRLDIEKMDRLRTYGEVQQVPEKRQQTLF
ncbi:flagellar assembly lipoprotein FlgP [Vibrio genomosp. F10]|uniref:Flagellar biosynthesis protein FlgP n=2 Tax=Vibrio genomosp. F10 TaxID=723171 RepID=A0A1B9QZT4_9VIBR|nr:flagellar assembly lipoprotein FlgP [Vibrio genomosp. F10]OCH76235.1 flagellar biosynthesis protein FlgP [Vibrio genomosp. F10]OEE31787.1 flagellar biosynthesis protein FlgP [Vibrio genomosp. F10 str. ZF-129]OEE93098.1 flagellar biosynthesis protein FlgP [Vibrio genomosp. F10 str. 9ZC157]OEF06539.1 flagellar biosynthesis protein FlgP [Vibrio genomosp. F10 str. 9ZD137]OEF09181.1 flagellar biosynthesis protein FlgP [Vibrio genomosp. F10 str. 9ZB36]